MNENVYETEIASREELVAKINTTSMEIRQCGLGNVQREIRRCAEACVRGEGGILSIYSSQPLDLVGARRHGDTDQLTKHKQLTIELSDKMSV